MARVSGSLTADTVQLVVAAVDDGALVVDLRDVFYVEDAAVHVLARLAAGRCALASCPRWLELWLARVRGKTDIGDADRCPRPSTIAPGKR
jgi:hypothetical protein